MIAIEPPITSEEARLWSVGSSARLDGPGCEQRWSCKSFEMEKSESLMTGARAFDY